MNLDYKYLLDGNFHPESRVWIYQSSRLFSMGEALEVEELITHFADNWLSHGVRVKGAAYLFFGQFIVLIADETATGVSGCSTDSSVRLIKEIERQFDVTLFDRTTFAFVINDTVQLLPVAQVQYAFGNHFIDLDTLYFDNTVQTKRELEERWIAPIKETWLAKRISIQNPVS